MPTCNISDITIVGTVGESVRLDVKPAKAATVNLPLALVVMAAKMTDGAPPRRKKRKLEPAFHAELDLDSEASSEHDDVEESEHDDVEEAAAVVNGDGDCDLEDRLAAAGNEVMADLEDAIRMEERLDQLVLSVTQSCDPVVEEAPRCDFCS